MPWWTSKHIAWLVDTGDRIQTADGKLVTVLELRHKKDEEVLSVWAKHFRNHYCRDTEIDAIRGGTGCSRCDYLNTIKFPDAAQAPGPSIRAGDFGEILVADYVQYVLDHWVPRTRYSDKATRNESTKGSDIIGFRLAAAKESPKDSLMIFESKASLSGTKPCNRLQDAVDGSARDRLRKAESLNAIKQRLLAMGQADDAKKVERFQNRTDRPYQEKPGAAALVSNAVYEEGLLSQTTVKDHPDGDRIMLVVIKGDQLMRLVNDLYRKAADEA